MNHNRGRKILLYLLIILSPIILIFIWEIASISNYENADGMISIRYRDGLGELNRPLMAINELYYMKIRNYKMYGYSCGNSLRGWMHGFIFEK